MTGGRRLFGTIILVVASAMTLTGCLSGQIPTPGGGATESSSPQSPETSSPDATAAAPTETEPTSTAYDGWDTFEPCGHEYGVEWQWVDGFPAGEMEDNGLLPQCGELWLASRGASESLLSVMVDYVSAQTIADFGASLEDSGYVLDFDTFEPDAPPQDAFYGALIYYLDGDTGPDATVITIEAYGEAVHNDEFQIYIDYASPGTRAHP